ncbi:DUF3313 domain-containing protein [Pseudomonas panipatensis]|uniref:DUF3313 domain-containing protein n=1 Tax=Pseudomonas panipatensis TaxID=428992 RepID=A0A1G8KY43_9PSED|nr:DUF3313 domain-containing protein [Pseudomonas panipatensis]SDI48388.1 Protein of unknown function [Pseudomonas panipatensis]SMP73018.1 Protein of unknown function [Pseudomonas panipatensis]
MGRFNRTLFSVVLSSVLLGACVSNVTEKEQYSGFLPNYSGLKEETSPSGHPVMRWVDPSFKPRTYSTVVFDKLQMYPAPKPNERVNKQTLQDLQTYASDYTRETIALRYKLVPDLRSVPSGQRAMLMKAAITGVSASNEGMKWYEVIPVAAVVGATSAATGHRDQNTELYIEASISDAETGKPLVYVVRKVFGQTLENDKQAITANDFKAAIKELNSDLSIMLNR